MSNKRNKEAEMYDSASEEEQESGSEKGSDVDSDGNFVGDQEIQADFEGRNPEDCDFHGIKQLLRQLFLKSNVDLGALTQIIISQNYVGSVVKQCLDDGIDEDEEDDGSDGVFGVTTVINITKRKDDPCIQQVRALLTKLAEDNANDKTKALVNKILNDVSKHVGLVINERILNIPAAISVPLFASLQTELEKAVKKNMPYTFQYLVWICKIYNTEDDPNADILFANQEEKPIVEEALASFDVNVKSEAGLSQWDDDCAMTPYRKVLIFDGSKFNQLVRLLKEEVESTQ
ncbi:protein BCCIP homolog [Epargyreus clarus]|uniref:protein BCCIP homolog n=1 Tax=Epargyreus clarus TaxID=520877 RepID=UPI003C2B7E4C